MSGLKEQVLKEHPNYTVYFRQICKVCGVGNLILTNRRLTFLNRIALSEEQIEHVKKLAQDGSVSKSVDYVLSLDSRNFEVPLKLIQSVGLRLSVLGFALQVTYRDKSGRSDVIKFKFKPSMMERLIKFVSHENAWKKAIKRELKRIAAQ